MSHPNSPSELMKLAIGSQAPEYDAIVVGARVAGAATAMLLARRGRRVLLVDRRRPGSDTLSTHALMRAGVLQLRRWGLLDSVIAAGTPAIHKNIMRYLCSKAPGQTLLPSDAKGNADVMRWQAWSLAHWGPACGTCIFENLVKVLLRGEAPDPARVAEGQERVKRFGKVLDDYLEGRKFLVGDSLTLADVTNAVVVQFAAPAKLPIGEFKEIQRWFASLDQFPAWKATAPQLPAPAPAFKNVNA